MGQNPFTDEIKTRVPEAMKRQLMAIADGRDLDLSDVVREALREYLARQPGAAPSAAPTSQFQETETEGIRS